MDSPILEKFEIPTKELPKVMEDPKFSATSSYLFQKCKIWTGNGIFKTICTTKDISRFRNIFSSLRDIYDDMHAAPLSGDAKKVMRISSFPETQKEYREYGYLAVIFCDSDLMLKISGKWYVATKDQSSQGIVISGALDPILPSIAYKCVGNPTLLISLSLEPDHTSGETRIAYQYLSTTPRDARGHDAGPKANFYV